MKILSYLLLVLFFALMVYTAMLLPPRGAPDSPVNRQTSAAGTPVAGAYFINEAYHDAGTVNMVTVVLADYRGFDTLGETVVVFTAGIACLLILGRRHS